MHFTVLSDLSVLLKDLSAVGLEPATGWSRPTRPFKQ